MDQAQGNAAVIGSVLTIVIGAIVGGIVKLMTTRHDNTMDANKRSLDEAFKLLGVKDKEIDDLRKEGHDLRNKLGIVSNEKSVLDIKFARLETKFDNLQERFTIIVNLLKEKGGSNPFDDGSRPHTPIDTKK